MTIWNKALEMMTIVAFHNKFRSVGADIVLRHLWVVRQKFMELFCFARGKVDVRLEWKSQSKPFCFLVLEAIFDLPHHLVFRLIVFLTNLEEATSFPFSPDENVAIARSGRINSIVVAAAAVDLPLWVVILGFALLLRWVIFWVSHRADCRGNEGLIVEEQEECRDDRRLQA